MRKKKLFAGVMALAMTVMTVFSSVGTVKAEEGNVTDKPSTKFECNKEYGSKTVADDDWKVIRKWLGLVWGSNNINIFDKNDSISIDWENSARKKSEVQTVWLRMHNFYRADDNTLHFKRDYNLAAYNNKREIWSIYDENGDVIEQYRVLEGANGWYDDELFADMIKKGWESDTYDLSVLANSDGTKYGKDDMCFYSLDVLYTDGVSDVVMFMFEDMGNGFNYKTISEEPSDSEDYILDMTTNTAPVSSKDFASLLSENATKDVVIKSNNNVTFTFAKGTMQAVDGKESYDFSTTINSAYTSDMPSYITQNNFVSQINFNYSGKLPAEAKIRFYAGTQYAGKTLYYSLMNEDKTFAEVQAVVVDSEGYMTVKQNHCSSYVVTTEEPKVQENPTDTNTTNTDTNGTTDNTAASTDTNTTNTDTNGTTDNTVASTDTDTNGTTSPKTGDTMPVMSYVLLCVSAIGLLTVMRKKNVTM